MPFTKVLVASLKNSTEDVLLQVLVIDDNKTINSPGLSFHSINSLENTHFFKEIKNKYAHTDNPNHFRWALKPIFINYLLENGFSKVLYIDPDQYFVNDSSFLFDELDTNNILLTPHWPDINPIGNEDSLFAVLRGGLFNAGFIGSNIKGKAAMEWWAEMCHYKMERRKELGLFDDQKYLDILPVQFPNVQIIKHQGCNLASWNIDACKREMINGELRINKTYKPVFIHFSEDTIVNILNQNDKLLQPFLDEYIAALKKENIDLLNSVNHKDKKKDTSFYYAAKHKLRLRTRIKRFLFKLAEKI
ncbi:hypothetical protein CAP36_15120 [Chitinophagaceae bacterium IBVUCB2]|nr:hypothetical protein CAP36_15120 [Chitinophagaceae bacterium IBVUCB2]